MRDYLLFPLLQKHCASDDMAINSLYDVAVEALIFAATQEACNDRVCAILDAGVEMLNGEGNNMPGNDATTCFVCAAGYCSRELGAGLPGFMSRLIEALVGHPDGHQLLVKYVQRVATQLSFRPPNADQETDVALSATLACIARDLHFRHCEQAGKGVNGCWWRFRAGLRASFMDGCAQIYSWATATRTRV